MMVGIASSSPREKAKCSASDAYLYAAVDNCSLKHQTLLFSALATKLGLFI